MKQINNLTRIRQTSRQLIKVFWGLIILAPLIDTLIWMNVNHLLAPIQHEILPDYVRLPLPPMARFLGWCVSLIPLSLFLYGCKTLINLFRLYEKGEIFGDENVRYFVKLSRILIGFGLAGILADPLQSIALTLHHPAGERCLALSLSSNEVLILIVAFILAVISRVMEEGRKVAQEQELTI